MTQDGQTIILISGVVIPILVGLLAKAAAPSGLKAILNAALTGAAAVLSQTVPGDFRWRAFFTAWAATWVVAVATHFGFYKPTGVTGAVQSSTANVGVG